MVKTRPWNLIDFQGNWYIHGLIMIYSMIDALLIIIVSLDRNWNFLTVELTSRWPTGTVSVIFIIWWNNSRSSWTIPAPVNRYAVAHERAHRAPHAMIEKLLIRYSRFWVFCNFWILGCLVQFQFKKTWILWVISLIITLLELVFCSFLKEITHMTTSINRVSPAARAGGRLVTVSRFVTQHRASFVATNKMLHVCFHQSTCLVFTRYWQ